MRFSEKHKLRDSFLCTWLCVLGIVLAAMAPFVASQIFLQTSPADEMGAALLVVALVAIGFDRK